MASSKPNARPRPPPDAPRQSPETTETTPLLTGGQPAPDGDGDAPALLENGSAKSAEAGKPLPKLQILLLCYARMM